MTHENSPGTLLVPSQALDGEFVLPASAITETHAVAQERLALRVGPVGLLVSAGAGREVVPPPAVSRLPHLPAWLLGLANVRGTLLPVIELARALEVERESSLRSYLFIAGAGETAIGFLVDGLPLPRTLDPATRLSGVPPHPAFLAGCVTGGYEYEGRVWLETRLDALLDTLARYLDQAA